MIMSFKQIFSSAVLVGALSIGMAAQTDSASRNDPKITTGVTEKLQQKSQFENVKSSVHRYADRDGSDLSGQA
jgi:hypothetical protein